MLAAEGFQVSPVQPIQPQIIHFVQSQAGFRRGLGDGAIALHFRVVPAAAQQPVADARRPAAAAGDGLGPFGDHGHSQKIGAAGGNDREIRAGVELQAMHHAEAVVQGLGNQPCPGGRAHEGEGPQIHLQSLGRRPLADEDVQLPVLHG